MMISTVLAAALSFTFYIHQDPMTDAQTFTAEVGNYERRALSIECGALTNDQMMVRIRPDKLLYQRPFSAAAKYRDRVRFGTEDAETFALTYRDKEAIISGEEALRFTQMAKLSETVLIEMTDYRSRKFTIRFPLTGASEAIENVEKRCT